MSFLCRFYVVFMSFLFYYIKILINDFNININLFILYIVLLMPTFSCPNCKKEFNRKSNFLYHVENKKRPCKIIIINNNIKLFNDAPECSANAPECSANAPECSGNLPVCSTNTSEFSINLPVFSINPPVFSINTLECPNNILDYSNDELESSINISEKKKYNFK